MTYRIYTKRARALDLVRVVAAEVARPRERGEEEQHPRAAVARDRMALVGVEPEQGPTRPSTSRRRASIRTLPSTHGQPRVLLDLVVAERLARLDRRSGSPGRPRPDAARPRRGCRSERRSRSGPSAPRREHYPSSLHSTAHAAQHRPLPARAVSGQLLRRPRAARLPRGGAGGPGRPGRGAAARAGAARDPLQRILVTHTDLDHIGAVAELAGGTGAEVWCPAAEAEILRDPASLARAGGVPAWEPEHLVEGGDTVAAAGISFEVVGVPGHSSGHVAYFADGCLFSGDVLFAGSVGRTDLPGGDWETLLESIRTLFDRFPPETRIYSGHGGETTLGAERATNPFLAELRV